MAGQRNRTRTPSSSAPAALTRKLTTSAIDRGRALADFLAERLTIDRADAETLVRSGAVYLGRRRIENPTHILDAARRLTIHLPLPAVPPAPSDPAAAPLASATATSTRAATSAAPSARGAALSAAAPVAADTCVPASAPVFADASPPASRSASAPSTSAPASPSAAPFTSASEPSTSPSALAGSAPPVAGSSTLGGVAPSAVAATVPSAAAGPVPSPPAASARLPAAEARTPVTQNRSATARSVIEWIAYGDREVIVIDKPAGVASQATRAASAGALDRLVTEVIDPDARLLHRIDRNASGLVLFTRTPTARRRFASFLAAYQLERTYCAAVWGHWQRAEGALSGPIGRDPRDHRRMAVGPGRPALTRFRLIRRGCAPGGEPVSLLQLELVTGRTHQIRVHLADAGHPICGDALYGPDRQPLERLFLHALRLAWPGAAPVLAPMPSALSDLVG